MSGDDFKTLRELAFYASAKRREAILAALDRIEASAAAMREALMLACDRQSESWRAWIHEEGCRAVHDADAEDACDGRFIAEQVAAALATDAGRAKLDEMENAHASCRIERARAEKAEAERDALRDSLTACEGALESWKGDCATLRAEVERLRKFDTQRREQVARLQSTLERLQSGRPERAPGDE